MFLKYVLLFFRRGKTLTSPTYFWTSSDPMTLIKQASVRLATARAHRVFPVPGGPNSKTPFGGSIPRFTKRSGCGLGQNKTALVENEMYYFFKVLLLIFTYMEQRGLNHFSELLYLLFASSDITIGHIRLLLHLFTQKIITYIKDTRLYCWVTLLFNMFTFHHVAKKSRHSPAS